MSTDSSVELPTVTLALNEPTVGDYVLLSDFGGRPISKLREKFVSLLIAARLPHLALRLGHGRRNVRALTAALEATGSGGTIVLPAGSWYFAPK